MPLITRIRKARIEMYALSCIPKPTHSRQSSRYNSVSHHLAHCHEAPLTSGGGPTGRIMRSMSWILVCSFVCPSPMLMYCSMGGCPMYEASESRAMFEVHSKRVVSLFPVPTYRDWSASSCCCARSLSAILRMSRGCAGRFVRLR